MRVGAFFVAICVACALLPQAVSALQDIPAGESISESARDPYMTTDDPTLFDISAALDRVTELRNEERSLEREIAASLASIDAMADERQFLDLNEPQRARALQVARSDARRLAVTTYVSLGAPAGINVLDAESTGDVTYRHALLRQHAERLTEAAHIYSVLAGEANENVVLLSDSIDVVGKRIEARTRDLNELRPTITYAQWVASIAEIHDEADRLIAENGRSNPQAEQWQKLRFCESTDDYAAQTNFSFDANAFGAYQFEEQTWETVGGIGNPLDALPAEQDARARLLYANRGRQPWPLCGRYLPR